jgi:hypothetical protein
MQRPGWREPARTGKALKTDGRDGVHFLYQSKDQHHALRMYLYGVQALLLGCLIGAVPHGLCRRRTNYARGVVTETRRVFSLIGEGKPPTIVIAACSAAFVTVLL